MADRVPLQLRISREYGSTVQQTVAVFVGIWPEMASVLIEEFLYGEFMEFISLVDICIPKLGLSVFSDEILEPLLQACFQCLTWFETEVLATVFDGQSHSGESTR